MDDTTKAEGFYYSVGHLIEAGCIENHDDETMFAFHSTDTWDDVSRHLRKVWGYGNCWGGPHLLKQSSIKDGRTNYVFKVDRLT